MANKEKRPMTEYRALTLAIMALTGDIHNLRHYTIDANAYAQGFINPGTETAAQNYAELAEAIGIVEELRERIKAQPILKNNLRLF